MGEVVGAGILAHVLLRAQRTEIEVVEAKTLLAFVGQIEFCARDDVVDVHLAFCRATYLTASISGQYALSDNPPLTRRTLSPSSAH